MSRTMRQLENSISKNLKVYEITIDWLRDEGACSVDKCAALFNGSQPLLVTGGLILRAQQAGVLTADWLAERILTAPALAEYERVTAPALAEYKRVTAQVLADYADPTHHGGGYYDA